MKENGIRWQFFHEFYKKDGELAPTVKVEGAWLDLSERKLAVPPPEVFEVMEKEIPRTEDFHWL